MIGNFRNFQSAAPVLIYLDDFEVISMKKRGVLLTTLMAVVLLLIFSINIKDYGKSYQSFPDEEIPLARLDASSLIANQSDIVSRSNEGAMTHYLNRTLIILAVLIVLWGLCIYLAVRLNLFMSQDDKKDNKTKGSRVKT